MEHLAAITADGVRLVLRRFRPAGVTRAVALCTHAMMAHGGYFHARGGGFAAHLAGRGVDTFVLDWRGHGESKPPRAGVERWCFDDYVELDLPAALAAVAAATARPVAAIELHGHSLGGLVGLAAIATGAVPPPRRLCLWATAPWLPGPRGSLLRRAALAVYAASSRPLGRAPIRAFRLGSEDEPRDYVEQLAGWGRSGRFTSRTGVDYLAALSRLALPVWAATGEGDRLCRPADADGLLAYLPASSRPRLRAVGRAHGDAIDPDHFALFTDARLAPLWDEAIALAPSIRP